MNINQPCQHPVTTNVYQSDFLQDAVFRAFINDKKSSSANENYASEQQTPDDILLRMERLRTLANSKRREEFNSRRQQYSFCF